MIPDIWSVAHIIPILKSEKVATKENHTIAYHYFHLQQRFYKPICCRLRKRRSHSSLAKMALWDCIARQLLCVRTADCQRPERAAAEPTQCMFNCASRVTVLRQIILLRISSSCLYHTVDTPAIQHIFNNIFLVIFRGNFEFGEFKSSNSIS